MKKESSTASSESANDSATKAEKQPPLIEQDENAVEVLSAAGFGLTKNDQGLVIGASIDLREESPELLQNLGGLAFVETMKLSGTGITGSAPFFFSGVAIFSSCCGVKGSEKE